MAETHRIDIPSPIGTIRERAYPLVPLCTVGVRSTVLVPGTGTVQDTGMPGTAVISIFIFLLRVAKFQSSTSSSHDIRTRSTGIAYVLCRTTGSNACLQIAAPAPAPAPAATTAAAARQRPKNRRIVLTTVRSPKSFTARPRLSPLRMRCMQRRPSLRQPPIGHRVPVIVVGEKETNEALRNLLLIRTVSKVIVQIQAFVLEDAQRFRFESII